MTPAHAHSLEAFAPRLGEAHFEQRLSREQEERPTDLDKVSWKTRLFIRTKPSRLIRWGLKATFLYKRGRRNFLNLRVVEVPVTLPHWPRALHGFKLLQLSDLHLDLEPALVPVIRRRLGGVGYDATVFTGDFKNYTESAPDAALALLDDLLPSFRPPFYGVLGNHDTLSMAPLLEQRGIRMLMNEHVVIEHEGASFALGGVDDSYYFKTDDIPRAFAGVDPSLPRVLLSHAPSNFREAVEGGVHYFISGHTHGGQICNRQGKPYLIAGDIPPALVAGRWKYQGMYGYTSRGTGGGHVPIRFNCPPEISVHIFKSPEVEPTK